MPENRGPVVKWNPLGMTKKDLVKRLEAIKGDGGDEVDHSRADQALVDYINDPEVSKAYDAIDKWYA